MAPQPDGTLRLAIKERAVEQNEIPNASVQVGEVSATRQSDGTFVVSGLIAGDHAVTVKAKAHTTTRVTVPVHSGENTATLRISLTVQETYQRYYKAYTFRRLGVAYKYVHPDVRKRYSYATFKRDMLGGGESVSLKLGDTRILKKWTSKTAKRTYRKVTEIDRTIVIEVLGRRQTDNRSQHWILIDGLWYIIF